MKYCAVIPTYNNARTVGNIVRRTLREMEAVIVVNDGSTDGTDEILQALQQEGDKAQPTVISYQPNRGKGHALRRGLTKAREMGYDYAVTLDSDGQHYPEDIPLLLEALDTAGRQPLLVVGSRDLRADGMPSQNTFANKFSNFWFTLQTGRRLPDTQTGFRAYPLHHLPRLTLLTSRYESELELLVFSVWRGVEVKPVAVRVYYPPREERVSHFRPFADFFRISLLNTFLCLAALLHGYPAMAVRKFFRKREKDYKTLRFSE